MASGNIGRMHDLGSKDPRTGLEEWEGKRGVGDMSTRSRRSEFFSGIALRSEGRPLCQSQGEYLQNVIVDEGRTTRVFSSDVLDLTDRIPLLT